jgi:hypothetical protein
MGAVPGCWQSATQPKQKHSTLAQRFAFCETLGHVVSIHLIVAGFRPNLGITPDERPCHELLDTP